MAHTKAQGSVKGNRDSVAKRLGVKKYDGQTVGVGNIIVRQKGTRIRPANGVLMGKDYTLFAGKEGIVKFKKLRGQKFVQVLTA